MTREEMRVANKENRLYLRKGVGPLSAGTRVELLNERPLILKGAGHEIRPQRDDLVARRSG